MHARHAQYSVVTTEALQARLEAGRFRRQGEAVGLVRLHRRARLPGLPLAAQAEPGCLSRRVGGAPRCRARAPTATKQACCQISASAAPRMSRSTVSSSASFWWSARCPRRKKRRNCNSPTRPPGTHEGLEADSIADVIAALDEAEDVEVICWVCGSCSEMVVSDDSTPAPAKSASSVAGPRSRKHVEARPAGMYGASGGPLVIRLSRHRCP